MAKEIERQGILVVHCCSIVPISMTVGGNRIIPTTAIPHPFGDPTETKIKDVIKEKETELNKKFKTIFFNITNYTLQEKNKISWL